jgi:uncharacterized membrane protein (DUF4010 family)
MQSSDFLELAIALALGLLIGLQKERAESPLAGLRTFALVALAGGVAALLGPLTTPWLVVVGLAAVVALMVTGNVVLLRSGRSDPGQTTEVAVVLTYLIGVLTVVGPIEVAIVCGAVTAMLLHLREELHTWVDRLTDRDVRAMMQFVVVSLIVLPVLPSETFGPYDVINPRQVWWMVVLIVGLNLVGYAAYRLLGERAGTILAGVLGGVVSSTATTVGYARLTKLQPGRDHVAVVVVWVASGIVFIRLLIEIAAVAPSLLSVAAPPMLLMLAVFAVMAAIALRSGTRSPSEMPIEPSNPTELKSAILFGLVYAVVLLLVAAAQDWAGGAGLYLAATVSGLTDVDALTLSTSQLVQTDRLEASMGWRLIMTAAVSNLGFKLILGAVLGSRAFARRLATIGVVAIAIGVGLILFWP